MPFLVCYQISKKGKEVNLFSVHERFPETPPGKKNAGSQKSSTFLPQYFEKSQEEGLTFAHSKVLCLITLSPSCSPSPQNFLEGVNLLLTSLGSQPAPPLSRSLFLHALIGSKCILYIFPHICSHKKVWCLQHLK